MKTKSLILLSVVALLMTACTPDKPDVERMAAKYALVTSPAPDLSDITDNGKEVLKLYQMAADEVDAIYWKQNFGDRDALLDSLQEPSEQLFAAINYGPWNRIDGRPFLLNYGPKPLGARFYPSDMTKEEFAAWDNPDKASPYTLIRRDKDGQLTTEWYHDAYASNIDMIECYLRRAADVTIKASVRHYLLRMIEALKTDNYYDAYKAWLEMNDSKMDLVIGPIEPLDDALYGTKASYGAYVLLKNLQRTEELNELTTRLGELQTMLPGDPAHHNFVPGKETDIFSCTVLYCSGYTNAGYKVIGINFPYDARAQRELGTRTIIFDNIVREKFNRTVFPVGMKLLEDEFQPHRLP